MFAFRWPINSHPILWEHFLLYLQLHPARQNQARQRAAVKRGVGGVSSDPARGTVLIGRVGWNAGVCQFLERYCSLDFERGSASVQQTAFAGSSGFIWVHVSTGQTGSEATDVHICSFWLKFTLLATHPGGVDDEAPPTHPLLRSMAQLGRWWSEMKCASGLEQAEKSVSCGVWLIFSESTFSRQGDNEVSLFIVSLVHIISIGLSCFLCYISC